MNKKTISFLIAAVFSVIFTVQVFALDATVQNVKGKVEVKVAGAWKPVTNGQKVDTGAMISTAFKSSCDLKIGGSKITVKPLTRMQISAITPGEDRDNSEVFLDTGSIIADVKPIENKRVGFTVKSPAATASVRGTSGEVDAYGRVSGFTGTWYVTDSTGTKGFEVKPNQQVDCSEATKTSTPAEKDDQATTIPSIQTLSDSEAGKTEKPTDILAGSTAGDSKYSARLKFIIEFDL